MIAETLTPKILGKHFKPHRVSATSIFQDDGFGEPYATRDILVCRQADEFVHEGLAGDFYMYEGPGRQTHFLPYQFA